jgi:ATPase subunit of ABC transporter with duplicated ATPase domains
MISVSHLTLRFGRKVLFDDVTLKFKPGYCYGIIGANGSGKSTFLKVLSGQLQADEGKIDLDRGVKMGMLKQDQYAYDDLKIIDTVLMGREDLWKIQQERDALYDKGTLTDEEGHRLADLETDFNDKNGYAVTAGAGEFLENLGIESAKHEWQMKQLAGGWKLRVLLAQILYASPDLLLLDEPTNHLDIKSIKWLENYLNAYEGTILVVSHDRHFLNNICTHMADVDRQKITIYAGNYDFFKAASEQAHEAKMAENERKEKRISELKTFIARFSANASKSAQATSRAKLLDKIELDEIIPSSRQYPKLAFKSKDPLGKDVMEVRSISKGYGDLKVLKKMSFMVGGGEKIAILGPNGYGKTTLLKSLIGTYAPEDGRGRFIQPFGHPLDEGEVKWGKSVTLSYMPQDAKEELNEDITAVEWLKQFAPMQETQFLRGILGRMLFTGEEQDKKVTVLSGGECQRLMLSRMMMMGGNVLLLDEPTNHMDLESIESLSKALVEFPDTVVFTTHDQDLIDKVATRIIELKGDGQWVDFPGNYSDYQAWQEREAKASKKGGRK